MPLALLVLLAAGLAAGALAADQPEPQATEPNNRPAGEVYQKVEIFPWMPRMEFDRLMEELNVSLGVKCEHCHIKDQWEREDVDAKQTARKMFRMVGGISRTYFEGEGGPACWTCHRGSTEPQQRPSDEVSAHLKPVAVPDPSPFVADARPAAEVYMNIQLLKQVPANRLELIMKSFSQWLGVECSACHVVGQWERDEKDEKQMARKMVQMRADIIATYFDGEPKVGCWTCHRGSHEPATELPPAS
jgi:hypothetical protein